MTKARFPNRCVGNRALILYAMEAPPGSSGFLYRSGLHGTGDGIKVV